MPWKLVVTYDDSRAREIFDDFRCFRDDVWLYPAKDLLFYTADIHGNLITRQRMQVLRQIIEKQTGVVVTTIDGLMDHLLPVSMLESQILRTSSGDTIDLNQWKEKLTSLGYERMAQVDGMGQFSIRGGIIDIYPMTEELPLRIELWDDEVDSIRTFDPESQRSVEQLDEAVIYPATELVLTRKQIESGILKIEKAAKQYEAVLRKEMKTEEAHRIHTITAEVVEGLKEGWKISGIDSFLTCFCENTVTFLEYFSQRRSGGILR